MLQRGHCTWTVICSCSEHWKTVLPFPIPHLSHPPQPWDRLETIRVHISGIAFEHPCGSSKCLYYKTYHLSVCLPGENWDRCILSVPRSQYNLCIQKCNYHHITYLSALPALRNWDRFVLSAPWSQYTHFIQAVNIDIMHPLTSLVHCGRDALSMSSTILENLNLVQP